MQNQEQFNYCGTEVKYIFKEGRYDVNSMVVVLSGFGAKTLTTYDFLGGRSLSLTKSHVLWILDEFVLSNGDRSPTFYKNTKNQPNIESAVLQLIFNLAEKFNVSKDRILLLGASKGGWASLYYCLKYDFKNCIASAPTIELGDSLLETPVKRKIFKDLIEDVANEEKGKRELDEILYSLVKNSATKKHIVLLNSPSDERDSGDAFYEEAQRNNLIKLTRLIVDSPIVSRHNQITRYFSSAIGSIISLFDFNIEMPEGVHCINRTSGYQSSKNKLECLLEEFQFKGEFFYPEGFAFVTNLDSKEFGGFDKFICFKNYLNEFVYKIGSTVNGDLSSKYYRGTFIDYSTGGFASLKRQGIDLSSLPYGEYWVYTKVYDKKRKRWYSSPLSYKQPSRAAAFDSGVYLIGSMKNKGAYIKKCRLSGLPCPTYFKIKRFEISEGSLASFEGVFIVRHQAAYEWGDLKPFLVLHSLKYKSKHPIIFELGQKSQSISDISEFQYDISDYSKSGFACKKDIPIDLSDLDVDSYEISIAAFVNDNLYSASFGMLLVSGEGVAKAIRYVPYR